MLNVSIIGDFILVCQKFKELGRGVNAGTTSYRSGGHICNPLPEWDELNWQARIGGYQKYAGIVKTPLMLGLSSIIISQIPIIVRGSSLGRVPISYHPIAPQDLKNQGLNRDIL